MPGITYLDVANGHVVVCDLVQNPLGQGLCLYGGNPDRVSETIHCVALYCISKFGFSDKVLHKVR